MPLGRFITFFYGLIDAETSRLTYVNAAHNAPILVRRKGTALRLEKGGKILGVFPDERYEQAEVELVSGDRLLLFTDGVSEVQNSEGHEFGEERLIELLGSSCDLGATALQEKIINTVIEFCEGNFHDDVTLIALTVH